MPNAASDDGPAVELDGRDFAGVHFSDCTLIYRGAARVRFARCTFENCQLLYKGAVLLSSANLCALADALGDDGFSALFSPSSEEANAVVAAVAASRALAVGGAA